jgi:hypothetical protein
MARVRFLESENHYFSHGSFQVNNLPSRCTSTFRLTERPFFFFASWRSKAAIVDRSPSCPSATELADPSPSSLSEVATSTAVGDLPLLLALDVGFGLALDMGLGLGRDLEMALVGAMALAQVTVG